MLDTWSIADRPSEARSASLNRPGRNHVTDLSEDSRVEMVETFFTRKFSYFSNIDM
jgi:hypothetical protein